MHPPVVETLLWFLALTPREKLLLLLLAHAVILNVENGPYVIEVTQRARKERHTIQKHQMLHFNHIILSPFIISSSFHFSRIAISGCNEGASFN